MFYISLPLPAVAKPYPVYRLKDTLGVLGLFALCEVFTFTLIIGASWVINAPLLPKSMSSLPAGNWFFYGLALLIGMIVAFMGILIHEHYAKQLRWEHAIIQTYTLMLDDAQLWNWQLLGTQQIHNYFIIDIVHEGYLLRILVQAKFVVVQPGESNQVKFSSISFDYPKPTIDMCEPGILRFGGHVTVTYCVFSGPPELQESYNLLLPPRLGIERSDNTIHSQIPQT